MSDLGSPGLTATPPQLRIVESLTLVVQHLRVAHFFRVGPTHELEVNVPSIHPRHGVDQDTLALPGGQRRGVADGQRLWGPGWRGLDRPRRPVVDDFDRHAVTFEWGGGDL